MTRIGLLLRRAGAGLLLLLWLDVATANVVACAFGSSISPEHAQSAATHTLPSHADEHGISAFSARGECGIPQLLVVACVAPQILEPPTVTVSAFHPIVLRPHRLTSFRLSLDPPPPRA